MGNSFLPGDLVGVCGRSNPTLGPPVEPCLPLRIDPFGVVGVGTDSWRESVAVCSLAPSGVTFSRSADAILAGRLFRRCMSACFKVSMLERLRGCRRDGSDGCGSAARAARGVRRSFSCQAPSSPETDPLSEEVSLSPVPSLSQCGASDPMPPAVCWRIQSSVRPRAGRLARFARTAALTKEDDGCASWASGRKGAGRRNGVWISSWWIGESSDGPLLTLRLRKRDGSDRGYGEPQLAVTYRLSSARLFGDGVRRNSKALSGRRGAGSGGTIGDDSPSAVEPAERAGDPRGDEDGACGSPVPACAGAPGGSGGGDRWDDVVKVPNARERDVSGREAGQRREQGAGCASPSVAGRRGSQRTRARSAADERRVACSWISFFFASPTIVAGLDGSWHRGNVERGCASWAWRMRVATRFRQTGGGLIFCPGVPEAGSWARKKERAGRGQGSDKKTENRTQAAKHIERGNCCSGERAREG